MKSQIRRMVLAGMAAAVVASPVLAQKKYDPGDLLP